ncbi:MAG: NADH-quinone oxidoreductase subunit L [Pseudomonadota bacterium]
MAIDIPTLSTSLLLTGMPALLLLSALLPGDRSPRDVIRYRRRVEFAAVGSLVLALVAVLAYLAGSREKLVASAFSLPFGLGDLALSVQVDAVTLVVATLVAFVVTLIARYSQQYLDGDANQDRFFRILALTAGLFLLVVIAGNLLMFTLGIMLTGITLHRLLLFYPERPKASMAAHKKQIFSRTADLCLLAATLLIGHEIGSFEFDALAAAAPGLTGDMPWTFHVAAWLLAMAAIIKSAQFPFHGWLLQVMEAPTPVSALMHAGIVYSGAIVVLRTGEFLLAEGTALILLALVGLATLMVASLAMLTQTAIKASLAWSTVGQLGFMLMELGMGLYALALLHLVGHSLYKAHAFLSAGSIVDLLRQPKPPQRRTVSPIQWLAAVAVSVALTAGIAWAIGMEVSEEPALLALGAVVALATSQLVLKTFYLRGSPGLILRGVGMAGLMVLVYFVLHDLFVHAFAPALGTPPSEVGPGYWMLITLIMAGFLLLSLLQSLGTTHLPMRSRSRLFVHLYNGLYVDLLVERISYRLWPHKVGARDRRTGNHAERPSAAPRNRRSL